MTLSVLSAYNTYSPSMASRSNLPKYSYILYWIIYNYVYSHYKSPTLSSFSTSATSISLQLICRRPEDILIPTCPEHDISKMQKLPFVHYEGMNDVIWKQINTSKLGPMWNLEKWLKQWTNYKKIDCRWKASWSGAIEDELSIFSFYFSLWCVLMNYLTYAIFRESET